MSFASVNKFLRYRSFQLFGLTALVSQGASGSKFTDISNFLSLLTFAISYSLFDFIGISNDPASLEIYEGVVRGSIFTGISNIQRYRNSASVL